MIKILFTKFTPFPCFQIRICYDPVAEEVAEIFLRSQLDKKLLLDVRNSPKFPPKTPKFPNKTHQMHKCKKNMKKL